MNRCFVCSVAARLLSLLCITSYRQQVQLTYNNNEIKMVLKPRQLQQTPNLPSSQPLQRPNTESRHTAARRGFISPLRGPKRSALSPSTNTSGCYSDRSVCFTSKPNNKTETSALRHLCFQPMGNVHDCGGSRPRRRED